jgi:Fe-S cluster biogenesis protein NfuA
MQEEIKKALDEVRPALQRDGGDIEYVDFVDGVVKVRFKGMCAGCPMSQMTLTNFVEKAIKEKAPEVKKVESVR